MDDFVEMRHPTLPDNAPVRVARSSFENAWQKRGWVLASTPEKQTVAPAPKPAPRPAPRQSTDEKE
jgi:hypothetical protein